MSIKPPLECPLERPLRIATRRSPLAMAQSLQVRDALADALGLPAADREEWLPLVPYVTSGDQNQRSSLADIGGKGLFTKEIEEALLAGDADIAVHSMKDMPASPPDGLCLAAVPKRQCPLDAFVTPSGIAIDELPPGSRIGTSSTRRAAQVKRIWPDLDVVPFRGNVQTRLSKLAAGVADGTFLAEAGLRRLGAEDVARHLMAVDQMLPALSQGALYIQTRIDDEVTRSICASIHSDDDGAATAAERAIVKALDGTCRTPMAGLAEWRGDNLYIVAEILTPDGSQRVTAADRMPRAPDPATNIAQADAAGAALADRLREEAGPSLALMLGT